MQDVAVEPGNPHCFWSAAQDGRVHQFDLRCPDVGEATSASMLIQAPPSDGYAGLRVEFKALDINGVRTRNVFVLSRLCVGRRSGCDAESVAHANNRGARCHFQVSQRSHPWHLHCWRKVYFGLIRYLSGCA